MQKSGTASLPQPSHLMRKPGSASLRQPSHPLRKPGAPFQARRAYSPAFLSWLFSALVSWLSCPCIRDFCRMFSPRILSGYIANYIVTYLCSVRRTAPGPAYSSFTMPSSFSPRPASYRSAPKISARVKSLRRQLKS